jgi:general nucleoside transport system ATP-binding protein
VLKVEDLRVKDEHGVERLKGISFEIRAGEILGIAGVAGNGQSELLEALGGIAQGDRAVTLKGEDLPLSGKGGWAKPPRSGHRPCARGPAALWA